jgi:2-C-methyl-D-erythritol 2,4-cyclodiphosphate synthase
MRIGHGYDVHEYIPGDSMVLGGVKVDADYAIKAHSDGDVVIHAVCDALLGAAGLGDIGHFFPDTDAQNADRPSSEFLAQIFSRLQQKNYRLGNLDVTIIAQAPKMKPHLPAMQKNLSKILQANDNDVNLKATTTEGLGYIGKKQGIAVHAVCLIQKDS